ncbi:MAG: hypothetical protein F6K65_29580 [Moorea sp. SIO3C2]|nr:hypothetical protein [Moorena sp. SIO3C2]
MIQELLAVKENESLSEICVRLGTFLGLEEPVPMNVLLRAMEDPIYANDLIICRNAPGFLIPLLKDPRNKAYEIPQQIEPKTNLELAQKAVKTLIGWGKAGFSVVDDETLARRENACLACPNLSEPQKLVQKLIPSKDVTQKLGERTGNKVCQLCGCNVGKKIRIPSESCPEQHPTAAAMTRWGEPRE